MRDQPSLRGQPLAVGGQPDQRGVVATCNYEARRFGIHSAMPMSQAVRRCPDLVILPPSMEKYRIASRQILAIYRDYTDAVEPLSLDEAFLDVSQSTHLHGSATLIAHEIRARIAQTVGITASAGVAPNKFLAKIASDWNKPDGMFVILPDQVQEFVAALPVKRLFGVGKVTATKLHSMGIHECKDLLTWSLPDLMQHFGKLGNNLYQLCRGIDLREVCSSSERKSVSVEETYTNDLPDLAACVAEMPELYQSLVRRAQSAGAVPQINKLYVKIRFSDFRSTTVECLGKKMNPEVYSQLMQTGYARGHMPVRLLGLGVRLADTDHVSKMQLDLF